MIGGVESRDDIGSIFGRDSSDVRDCEVGRDNRDGRDSFNARVGRKTRVRKDSGDSR